MTRTDSEERYGIRDLAQAAGVPRRTVRYYVQLGLVPPPEGAGRGHYYRSEHLERLTRIRELRDRGLSLEQVREVLEGRSDEARPPQVPPIRLATRIQIAEGVELVVSHDGRAPTLAQLRELGVAAVKILNRNPTGSRGGTDE